MGRYYNCSLFTLFTSLLFSANGHGEICDAHGKLPVLSSPRTSSLFSANGEYLCSLELSVTVMLICILLMGRYSVMQMGVYTLESPSYQMNDAMLEGRYYNCSLLNHSPNSPITSWQQTTREVPVQSYPPVQFITERRDLPHATYDRMDRRVDRVSWIARGWGKAWITWLCAANDCYVYGTIAAICMDGGTGLC